MEIAPVPRPRPLLRSTRRLVLLSAVVAVLVLGLLPTMLGLERYVVTSGSMAGVADRGSVVLARQVPVHDLRVGDVISFEPPGSVGAEPVTHRIVELTAGRARTRGDANLRPDPWLLPLEQATVSRAILVVPWVGLPFLGDRPRVVWAGLAVPPLVVLAALVAVGRRRPRAPGPPPDVDAPAGRVAR